MARIGVPRALAYYQFFPLWKTFFEALGHEVVVSSPTTRNILDSGVRETVSDACIPIKIYHGHVADLIGKVDCIFIPRLVSLRKFGDFGTETLCPKFLGLPDMVIASVEGLPPLLESRVDLKLGRRQVWEVFRKMGAPLKASEKDIRRAGRAALKIQKRFKKLLEKGIFPDEAMSFLLEKGKEPTPDCSGDYAVAVIGYPYAIYDDYVNVGLIQTMKNAGARVYSQDMLTERQLNRQSRKMPKDLFWFFSNRAVQGALYYMDEKPVDGVIHVTAFACGPDSMVDRYIEVEARRRSVPFMSVAIDEHTGEAGIRTRVEAFMDMLQYRRRRREG